MIVGLHYVVQAASPPFSTVLRNLQLFSGVDLLIKGTGIVRNELSGEWLVVAVPCGATGEGYSQDLI
jgi:hypothetical protein